MLCRHLYTWTHTLNRTRSTASYRRYRRKKVHVRYLSSADERLWYFEVRVRYRRITLAASSGKRNVTLWRPSVPVGRMQHATRYKKFTFVISFPDKFLFIYYNLCERIGLVCDHCVMTVAINSSYLFFPFSK